VVVEQTLAHLLSLPVELVVVVMVVLGTLQTVMQVELTQPQELLTQVAVAVAILEQGQQVVQELLLLDTQQHKEK
jgi:hypothetical protein